MTAKETLKEWWYECKLAQMNGHFAIENNYAMRKLEEIIKVMEKEEVKQ